MLLFIANLRLHSDPARFAPPYLREGGRLGHAHYRQDRAIISIADKAF